MTTDRDRDDLLSYLYGALPDEERTVLEKRLADDPELRARLDAARAEKDTLAKAAEISDPGVSLRPPRAKVFTMRKFGMAAGVLLALGLGFTGFRASHRATLAGDNPVLVAKGPGSFVPGTPAEYELLLTDADGDAIDGTVTVHVLGAGNEIRAKTDATLDNGRATVQLEPETGDPGERVRVQFVATTKDGERITQTLPLKDGTRVVARVSTDKPLYRPGETVRIRSIALEAFRLQLPGDVPVKMTMTDPRGGVVFDHVLDTQNGAIAWEHALPRDVAGGTYTVSVTGTKDDGLVAPAKRTFEVRSYRVPRLRFDMELDRDTYGPGDAGTAQLSVERAEGGSPTGATAEAVLRVDGEEIARETLTVGADGGVVVPFTLPMQIAEGRGQLSVTVEDGGVVETTAKTVPIALGRLDVELYPEGGELVAGIPSRVYFRARTPAGEPADVAFEVLDGDEVVAAANVDVRGMGVFELTPRDGANYTLAAISPLDVDLACEIPAVLTSGAVLRALDEATAAKAPIRVNLQAAASGTYAVEAWCRGGRLARMRVELDRFRDREIEIPTASEVGGVIRVTVFGPDGNPLAERLVTRQPPRSLSLTAVAAKQKYAPRERVEVKVRAFGPDGPVANAILGASVVDESVLALANDEDTAPMPMHFLLGMEVDELEKTEVYAEGPDAQHAVDLLLGVQGWRRFGWKNVDEFLAAHPEDGLRLVAVSADAQTVARDNRAGADQAVAYGMERFDERSMERGWAGGILLIVIGGVLLSIRSLWQRRMLPAIVGVVPALLLAAAFAFSRSDMQYAMAPGMDARVEMEAGGWPADAVAMGGGAAGDPLADWLGADGAPAPRRAAPALVEPNVLRLADAEAKKNADARVVGLADLAGRLRRAKRPMEGAEKELLDKFADMDLEMEELRVMKDAKQILVREYAYQAQKNDGTRSDFTEVLYWNALVITDEKGEATFAFDTSDSITSFRVAVDGHDGKGALGAADSLFENRVPFYVEPKFPVELSAGDELFLPVVVANDTDAPMPVTLSIVAGDPLLQVRGDATFTTEAAAGARTRILVPFTVAQGTGNGTITLRAVAGSGHDDVTMRAIPVVPRGYPRTVARSGVIEERDGTEFMLPADLNPVTVTGALKLYPSTLATLVDGLEGILREPNGCFEQASSSNYPNVLVMRYLQDQGAAAPAVARRARDLMKSGYAKLAGYECSELGYEWFGGDPGHEALSAYGLMEFVDMRAVFDVDEEMIGRTRKWLLERRDGDGGFRRNARALDSFGAAPDEITNAYITWALTEAGENAELGKELNKLIADGKTSEDPYVVGLAANAALNTEHADKGALVKRLAGMQQADGHFDGKTTSITSSRGSNLHIETTSIAALAFTKSGTHLADGEEAIAWLLQQRSGGSFGTTQATIMALRALVTHAQNARKTSTSHDVAVIVNGEQVATRHVAEGSTGVILFERTVIDALRPGENTIEVTASGDETLPWALTLSYATALPASSPDCPVTVATSLDTDTAVEGDTVGLHVELTNTTAEGIPMTLARVALPAGLEPRTEQLEELKKAGDIDFWETRPREITLYYRALAPSAQKVLDLDLTAAVPGKFEGPASSAYLYYGDDAKQWAAPLGITIQPRR